jgi:hypothetical protein
MYKHIEDNLCIGSKTFTNKCEIQNKPSRCYHESEWWLAYSECGLENTL